MRKLSLCKVGVSPKATHYWNQAYREVVGRAFPLCQAALKHQLTDSQEQEGLIHELLSHHWRPGLECGRREKVQVGNATGGGDRGSLEGGQAQAESLEGQKVKHQIRTVANFQNVGCSQCSFFTHISPSGL